MTWISVISLLNSQGEFLAYWFLIQHISIIRCSLQDSHIFKVLLMDHELPNNGSMFWTLYHSTLQVGVSLTVEDNPLPLNKAHIFSPQSICQMPPRPTIRKAEGVMGIRDSMKCRKEVWQVFRATDPIPVTAKCFWNSVLYYFQDYSLS